MAEKFNLISFFAQKFRDLGNELSKQALSRYFWRDLLIVFLGILLYTIGFSFLIYPQRVTTGGLMGICNIITIITGIKVDIPYNIANISLLVVAFIFLDKNFFLKTLIGIGILAIVVPIATRTAIPDPRIEEMWHLMILRDQPLLALILGAMMCGLGLGMIFSVNGSSGGTDVIVALISKYKNMSFGRIFIVVDGSIVLFSYIANVYLADIKIDALAAFDKLVMSIIEVVLLAMLRRGCTMLEAKGGYTGLPQKVLLVVVRKQHSVAISRIIEEIDPKAFVSQGAVKGVYGEGFESLKKLK